MPNDLTPSALPGKPITSALSPELRRLLESEPNEASALEEIASCGPLWHEAKRALPALRMDATRQAGEQGVREIIGRRFALYPQPDRSDAEWAAWWSDYYDVLADAPYASLEAAMAEYVKRPDSEFLPKPGKLLEMARQTPNRAAMAYGRARRAVGEAEAKEARREPSEQEKAAVGKLLSDFFAQMDGRKVERVIAPLPATHGKPDETGITPQLRALIARQRGEG